MMGYVAAPAVVVPLAGLFIIGGIGFTVVMDVATNWRRGFRYFNLHTKIMLTATPLLLLLVRWCSGYWNIIIQKRWPIYLKVDNG